MRVFCSEKKIKEKLAHTEIDLMQQNIPPGTWFNS